MNEAQEPEAYPCPACLKPLVLDTKDKVHYFCTACGADLEMDAETWIELMEVKPKVKPLPDKKLMEFMTKREYFAAMAMQALVTAIQGDSSQVNYWKCEGLAIYAIQLADALIEQLNKETK